jgi:two-component system LytT family response regulator
MLISCKKSLFLTAKLLLMQSRLLKTIIVDDEKPSREALSTYIKDFCTDIEIAAECDSVKTAYKAILQYQPQLVFLDIEMPNGNGFDLLQMFKTPSFKVIFVTAYSDYAIRAFRFAAADYLLKPVKVDELVDAVNKVRQELDKEHSNQNIQVLIDSLNSHNGEVQQLVIPDTRGYSVIKVNDIIMCEAEGYCTHFYLTGKRKITSSKSLKHFEEIFDNHQIIRVHRSFLVHLSKINGYTKQGEVRLEENLTCPLGDNYKPQFLQTLGK